MIAREESITPTLSTLRLQSAPVHRQVVIVTDACCELDPQLAATLGIMIMPRTALIDRQKITLDATRTLHPTCWEKPPRRVIAKGYTLGDLAPAYGQILDSGMSVLALHQPSRIDRAAHTALAARSVLLSSRRSTETAPPRIAVYELAHSGACFSFLIAAAARGAAEGLALHQLLTMLDQLQAMAQGYFFTSSSGPSHQMRQPGRQPGVARVGSEQIWHLSRDTGLFVCRARGWNLAKTLFSDGGMLNAWQPTLIRSSHPQFVKRLNAGRAALGLPPLEAEAGSAALTTIFSRGCVELVRLPEEQQITDIIDVIRRIERPNAPVRRSRSIGERQ